MKPASALALVAVGGFFFVLARRGPVSEKDENERVDVNEVVDAKNNATGYWEYAGSPVSVVSFKDGAGVKTYNIGEVRDGLFYAETGNTSRRTTFSTLEQAVKIAQERNGEGGGGPVGLPEQDPAPARPNPYDLVDGFGGFGTDRQPSYGW
jgi:hypothetical protein